LPLYTEADAILAPEQLSPVAFGQPFGTGSSLRVELQRAGHILGAASVLLQAEGIRVVFSGDLGPTCRAVMRAPHERANAMADSSACLEAGDPSVGISMCWNMALSSNVFGASSVPLILKP
jgi:hypothetical protein